MLFNCSWLLLVALQALFCDMTPLPTTTPANSASSPSTVDISSWENIFKGRSIEEWRANWHTETHKRCFQELENHMRWVCLKDIYKVKKAAPENLTSRLRRNTDFDNDLFVSRETAFNILGHNPMSIRRKRGIIEECCHTDGCSWEEYAEYCTHNNRMRIGT